MKRNQKVQSQRVQKEKFVRQQFPQIHPSGENQKNFLDSMKDGVSIVAACGAAGVGKSLLALWHASKRLHYGDAKKIVLIRAYQPLAGRSIGLLPGTAEEKLLPYYQQMIDYLEDFLGKATIEIHIKNKTIEICSLETIRGRSWDDTIVVVDESQNLFVPEIQALVTRLGENTQMIFCGDNSGFQSDVKKGTLDGLSYLKYIVDKYSVPDVSFVQFTREDIVRSGITKAFVIAFEDEKVFEDSQIKGKVAK